MFAVAVSLLPTDSCRGKPEELLTILRPKSSTDSLAEGRLTTTKFSLDQLESEITCAICHEYYTDIYTLL